MHAPIYRFSKLSARRRSRPLSNSTLKVVNSTLGARALARAMVLGRSPYDRHTIAMLHENRMRDFKMPDARGHARELPALLRFAKSDRLNQTDIAFMLRMEEDVNGRRHKAFIAEVKKDPRFKPSMLEPPATTAFRKVPWCRRAGQLTKIEHTTPSFFLTTFHNPCFVLAGI